jgi:hypothetical protein
MKLSCLLEPGAESMDVNYILPSALDKIGKHLWDLITLKLWKQKKVHFR